jgi:5-methylcytosine-specific restriction endonuclease McrA
VLNDRQLFRHRQSSPWIEPAKKRVCLVSYVAFLIQKKHRKREGKTRRIAGKEVISFGEAKLILERQEYRCALTGLPLTPDNFALDHIVPVKQGGAFDIKNAQMVLKTVNRAKHTMSQQDFIQMCRNVAAYHGNQHQPKGDTQS